MPLTRFAEDTDAELVIDAVVGGRRRLGQIRLRDGGRGPSMRSSSRPAGVPVAGVKGATTWWPGGDPEVYGGLLRDIDEGYAKRIAIVVPPGRGLAAAGLRARADDGRGSVGDGPDDVEVTVVTPERAPLSLFGEDASHAIGEELAWAGVELVTGAWATAGRPGARPDDKRLDVQRVFACRACSARRSTAWRATRRGLLAGDDGRALGAERTWAAGDGIVSPIKFGGLATHQARDRRGGNRTLAGVQAFPIRASRSSTAGCSSATEPVACGAAATPRARRCGGRTARSPASTFRVGWPRTASHHPPRPSRPGEGVKVERSLRALRAPEDQYLFELGRKYRIDDPAIASLGRRMREARAR